MLAGVTPEKYDATCDISLSIAKYGASLPWYRPARMQKSFGAPNLLREMAAQVGRESSSSQRWRSSPLTAAVSATPTRIIKIKAATAQNIIAFFDRRRVHFRLRSVVDSFHAFGSAPWAAGRPRGLENTYPCVNAQDVGVLFRHDIHRYLAFVILLTGGFFCGCQRRFAADFSRVDGRPQSSEVVTEKAAIRRGMRVS